MFDMINSDRSNPAYEAETGGRAAPLRRSDALAAVARAHSEDMLKRGYFGHINLEGHGPGKRVSAAGIRWQAVGEIIAINTSVTAANAAFMSEPPFKMNHRGIILNRKYTDAGVGIERAPNGQYYITVDFIEQPKASAPGSGGSSETRPEPPPVL